MSLLHVMRNWIIGSPSPEYVRVLLAAKQATGFLWGHSEWSWVVNLLAEVAPDCTVSVDFHGRNEDGRVVEHRQSGKWVLEGGWTLEGPSDRIKYASMTLVAPPLKQCEKQGTWPDLYLEVAKQGGFEQVVHIAIARHVDVSASVAEAMGRIADIVGASFAAVAITPWVASGDRPAIVDFLTVGFFYRGIVGDPRPQVSKLKGRWTVVDSAKVREELSLRLRTK